MLDFCILIPDVPPEPSLEHSVHNSPSPRLTDIQPPRRVGFGRYNHHHRNGLVDHLEGKILGESLGDCRKPDRNSNFSLSIHSSLESCPVAPLGSVVYWNSRTDSFFTQRRNKV